LNNLEYLSIKVNHMPFRDGTGPTGQGPLTGRGLGPCGQKDGQTDKAQDKAVVWGGYGRGRGGRRGLGFGRGRMDGFGRQN
jgi:hypothetical protein